MMRALFILVFLNFLLINAYPQQQSYYLKFDEAPLPLGADEYYLQTLLTTEGAAFSTVIDGDTISVSLPIGSQTILSKKLKSSVPRMEGNQSPLVIVFSSVTPITGDTVGLKFDFLYELPQFKRQDFTYTVGLDPSLMGREYLETLYLEAVLAVLKRVDAIFGIRRGEENTIPDHSLKKISVEEYLLLKPDKNPNQQYTKSEAEAASNSSNGVISIGYQIGGFGIVGLEYQGRISPGFSMVVGAGLSGVIVGPRFHFTKKKMAPFFDLAFRDGGFGTLGTLGAGVGFYIPFNPQQSFGLTGRVTLGRIIYRREEITNEFLDPNAPYLIAFGAGISF